MSKFRLYKGMWICKENPHLQVKMSRDEAQKLLAGGGYLVRNAFNFDSEGPSGFWYVIKDSFGGMNELPTKVRNQVKKSPKNYDVKRISAEEMEERGYECYNLSRRRFGENTKISREQWHRQLFIAEQDYWIATDKMTGTSQALALNKQYDDYCDYITMGVNPEAPKSTYPMYGLIYEMNRYYLGELGMKYVLDGARSVTEHSNIQQLLEEKFKFGKAYCELQLFYKPLVGVAVWLLYPFRAFIKNRKVETQFRQEMMRRKI